MVWPLSTQVRFAGRRRHAMKRTLRGLRLGSVSQTSVPVLVMDLAERNKWMDEPVDGVHAATEPPRGAARFATVTSGALPAHDVRIGIGSAGRRAVATGCVDRSPDGRL